MTAPSPDPAAVADLARRLAAAMAVPDATAADVAAEAGGAVRDEGAPLGLHAEADLPGVETVDVTRVWDSEAPNAAQIRFAAPVPLSALEAELGPARDVPATKPGSHRVVFEGTDDWTALAGVEADGVRSLTVRL